MLSNPNHTSDKENIEIQLDQSPPAFTKLEAAKLEALAATFQENLFQQGLVHDHHQRSKTVTNAFLGSEAVTVLLGVLQNQADSRSEVTREEALQMGRKVQSYFDFFVHTKSTKKKELLLEDSETDLYHFHKSLPMQVYRMKKQYPSLWDKTKLLEEHIQVKSYRGIVRVYNDCFQAKNAVDALVDLKLVRSRKEAVHLMRKLMEKVQCFQPADHHSTTFRDNSALYKFVPVAQRAPEPVKRKSSASPKRSKSSPRSTSTTSTSQEAIRIPIRRTRTLGGESCSSSAHSGASSVTKDSSYFQTRASGIRSRLDVYRQERAVANAAITAAA